MKAIINYTPEALRWHLTNNVIGLTHKTVESIIDACNRVNNGELGIDDDISEGVTVSEMLADLQIDHD